MKVAQNYTRYQSAKSNIAFNSLRKIEYKGLFNPKVSVEDARAVVEAKNSNLFKSFFEKYDGIAVFNLNKKKSSDKYFISLNFKYSEPETKKGFAAKFLSGVKKIFTPKKSQYNEICIYSNENNFPANASWKLAYDVQFLNLEKIEKQIEYKKQEEATLKLLNSMIDK